MDNRPARDYLPSGKALFLFGIIVLVYFIFAPVIKQQNEAQDQFYQQSWNAFLNSDNQSIELKHLTHFTWNKACLSLGIMPADSWQIIFDDSAKTSMKLDIPYDVTRFEKNKYECFGSEAKLTKHIRKSSGSAVPNVTVYLEEK